jgi:tRNA (guanine37-N1)-methyltransferase
VRVDILTLFPEMFTSPFSSSIIRRARERGLVTIEVHDLRDWATGPHRQADDYGFGGGAGMVMKADVIIPALQAVRGDDGHVVYLSPQGEVLTQPLVARLARRPHLVLLCGHYQGIDERCSRFIDQEISLGDFVLTGGEIPAMAVTDAVVRLIPGVLGSEASHAGESFSRGLLEHPLYTRPRVVAGMEVPPVLLSGDHQAIRRWRLRLSLLRTLLKRPDLLLQRSYDAEERQVLEELLFGPPGGGR